jgi:DNA-binding GntR family transcriptional regulator
MKHNGLATRLASAIGREISQGKISPGTHLAAQALADQYGVSRSPVNEALVLLVDQGFARKEANRGVFVINVNGLELEPARVEPDPVETCYLKLAEDRLGGRLPDTVSANLIRDSYGLTHSQVQTLLTRIVKEGWLEPRAGYGFAFTEMLDSADALVQTYRMRMALEPNALLEPSYQLDPADLQELRETEERMLAGDIETMSTEELYDRGVRFHETIIGASRNPFFLDALRRINSIRRLLAYRSMATRSRYFQQAREHLEILDLLEQRRNEEASWKLRSHLSTVIHNLGEIRPLLEGRASTD